MRLKTREVDDLPSEGGSCELITGRLGPLEPRSRNCEALTQTNCSSSPTVMVQAAKVSASDGSDEANIGLRSAEADHLEHGDSDAGPRSPQTRSDMQTSSDMPELGHSMAPPDWSPAGVQDMLMPYLNKGSVSNLATFSVMLLGMMLTAATRANPEECPPLAETSGQAFARWVLAAGLFGFAGGITNWLAIKMLFDRVCNLPGSGVIPMRFKEIRQVIKDTIMKTFFDGPYLEQYMNKKMASLAGELDIGAKIKEVTGILHETRGTPRTP